MPEKPTLRKDGVHGVQLGDSGWSAGSGAGGGGANQALGSARLRWTRSGGSTTSAFALTPPPAGSWDGAVELSPGSGH
jgi:hypothetical protein